MVSASAVSVGDSVRVSDVGDVIVSGVVRDVFADNGGVRVKIREEDSSSIVEFWESDDRSRVDVGRRKVGSGRGGGSLKSVDVSNSARLVIVD